MIQGTKNLNPLQKWYVIDSQIAKDKYNQNNSIKFETGSIKSSLCDYFDAFILVTEDITVTADNDKDVSFKNCSSCKEKQYMLLIIQISL